MNKAILIGRLTKDPEIRYTQSSEPLAIARYTVACDRRFKREGEPDADFIGCVSFGKQAELMEKYFKKGSKIALTGRIQVRSYDDAQGVRRWSTEVVTDEIEFVESKAAFEARMASHAAHEQGGGFNQGGGYGQGGGYNQGGGYGQGGGSAGFANDHSPAHNPPEGFEPIAESIDDDDLPF
jgi:single-strand DNA-binding protein